MRFLLKFLIVIIFFSFSNCSSQKIIDKDILEITYKAETRGAFIDIEIGKSLLTYKSVKENKLINLTKVQIEKIRMEVLKIELPQISNIEAPSNNRFTDRAMNAKFTIIKNNISYVSSDFDHENPPSELKGLYKLLVSFIN